MALAQAYPAAAPVARTAAPAQLDALAAIAKWPNVPPWTRCTAHGDWRTSATEFARVVALDPAEPRGSTARYNLGIAQAHIGDYSAAEGDVR